MKKQLGKALLTCALALCMLVAFALPAAALGAGEATLVGTGPDGTNQIRVEKGGSTSVTYTLDYKDPADVALTDIGSAYFFVKYADMTYHEDATSTAGVLERNDIMNSDKENLKQYNGMIRMTKVAINNKTFAVTIPFTDVEKTNSLTIYPKEFFGKTANPTVAPELNYVASPEVQFIVQYPVTVKITDAGPENKVAVKTTAYSAGKDTYAPTGTEKTLSSGAKIYVDSDTDNAKPTFIVTETATKTLTSIMVNGKNQIIFATITGSGTTKNVVLPDPITADTEVEFVFLEHKTMSFGVTFYGNLPTATGVPGGAQVMNGDLLEKPADPSAPGYTFKGWFTDAAATEPYDFSKPVTTFFALYAGWEKNTKVTVTLDNGDGTTTKVEANVGDVIPLTPPANRDGYTFDGWYSDPEHKNPVTSVTASEDTTIYAGWSEDSVFTTDHVAYIQGYPDGTVRPTKSISRAEVATIFYRLLKETVQSANTTEVNNFTDVSSANWFNKEVSTLAAMGVLTGYPDGTFGPNKPITRAEFATLTVRFVNVPDTTENPFSDISGHWAENNIKRAAAAKLVEGSNGKFRPGDNITRAEAMTVVNRLLHRLPETPEDLFAGMTTFTDVPASAWYYLAVEEATNTHDHAMKADGIHEKWTGLK